jgi:hypothetical protein
MSAPTQVPLAGGPLAIRWTNRAQYRLGKLEQPPTLDDLKAGGERFLSALCDYLWAAQDFAPPARPRFAAPEDIITHITADNFATVAESFLACFTADNPDAKKKASPNGLGPESTSASPETNSTPSPSPTTPS